MKTRLALALLALVTLAALGALANGWREIETMTRSVARAIGRAAQGEAAIADMRRRLAKAKPAEPRAAWPTAIYYRPDGGGAGSGAGAGWGSSAGARASKPQPPRHASSTSAAKNCSTNTRQYGLAVSVAPRLKIMLKHTVPSNMKQEPSATVACKKLSLR